MFTITIKNDGHGTIMHTKGGKLQTAGHCGRGREYLYFPADGYAEKESDQQGTGRDRKIQSFFDKDAAFMAELMKRQGEVQG